MKKNVLMSILVMLCLAPVLFAQDWSQSLKWVYTQNDFFPDDIPEYRFIEKLNDVTIDGYSCIEVQERFVKIVGESPITTNTWNYILYYENSKMYYVKEEDSSFKILYDFTLEEGDVSQSYCPFADEFISSTVVSVEEIEVNGQLLKKQTHEDIFEEGTSCFLNGIVIEYIGSLHYLFPQESIADPPSGGYLNCFQGGNEFFYPITTSYCDVIASNDKFEKVEDRLYPNPVHDKIFIEVEDFKYAILINQLGCEISTHFQNEINVDHLSNGLYYLKIVKRNKEAILKKVIKTN